MTFDFKKLKEKFKHKAAKSAPLEISHIAYPERDWHYVVIAFFVLCISSGLFHYLLYRHLDAQAEAGVVPAEMATSTTRVLKRKQLEQISKDIERKEALLETLIATPLDPISPR